MKGLYKYPQAPFPYAELVEENRRRDRSQPEFELLDTGVFDGDRYFDVAIEYAKASPNDLLIRVEVANRGPEAARLHVLPTLWFRNTWSWGRSGEGYWPRPQMACVPRSGVVANMHARHLSFRRRAEWDGRTNLVVTRRDELHAAVRTGEPDAHVKDAFQEYVRPRPARCP